MSLEIIVNFQQLSIDENIPKFETNLVYLTVSPTSKKIEHTILDSIVHGMPKRADTYWFVHVNVTDEPYTLNYTVENSLKTMLILFLLSWVSGLNPE